MKFDFKPFPAQRTVFWDSDTLLTIKRNIQNKKMNHLKSKMSENKTAFHRIRKHNILLKEREKLGKMNVLYFSHKSIDYVSP